MSRLPLETVAIVGTGLIGGALGMALRSSRAVGRVLAYDADPHAARRAVERGAADAVAPDLRGLAGAQVVIVSTPLGRIAQTCLALRPYLSPDAIVTDTGSVKAPVVRAVERAPQPVRFVGGHPMAGSEGRGIEDADPAFLRGRPYLLTPTGFTDREAVAQVADLVRAVEMVPVVMQPEVHDRLVALSSHLPYLVSCAVLLAAASEPESLEVGGPTFREMGRLARNPVDLWEPIVEMNRDHLLQALGTFRSALDALERAVAEGHVRPLLEKARAAAQRTPGRGAP